MADVLQLLPHAKKDVKLDTKDERRVVNEIADMKGCTSTLLFECRKGLDLYLWLAKTPNGPSCKFHVANVHTMAELKLTGNHLKGSRPVLSFDAGFDAQPHLQLLKEVLTQVFATPRNHQKSKPFFDHVLAFTCLDGRIWFRNYQVVPPKDKKRKNLEDLELVECGPRFCLNPVKIFAGSFQGATLYENPLYVTPNARRSAAKRERMEDYRTKQKAKRRREDHEARHAPEPSEFAGMWGPAGAGDGAGEEAGAGGGDGDDSSGSSES